MLITWKNVELQNWTPRIDASVDAVLAEGIESYIVTDEDGQPCREVALVTKTAGGAGLVSATIDWALVRGAPLQYAAVAWWVKNSSAAAAMKIRDEYDWIGVHPGAASTAEVANHYNGSWQNKAPEGEIDIWNWTDTGLRFGAIPADVWVPIVNQYKVDVAAQKLTFVSTLQGQAAPAPAKSAAIPAAVATAAADVTNWGYYPADTVPGQQGGGPFSEQHLQVQGKCSAPNAGFTWRFRCTVYASDEPLGALV